MNRKEMMERLKNKQVRNMSGLNVKPQLTGIGELEATLVGQMAHGKALKDICEVEFEERHMSHLDRLREAKRVSDLNNAMIMGREIDDNLRTPITGATNPAVAFQTKAIEYFGGATYKGSLKDIEKYQKEYEEIEEKINNRHKELDEARKTKQDCLDTYKYQLTVQERHELMLEINTIDSIMAGAMSDTVVDGLKAKAGDIMEKYTMAKAYKDKFEFDNADVIAEVRREQIKNEII